MQSNRSKFLALVTSPLWIVALPVLVFATQVTIPNTFTAGTVADASQVNANFTALRNAINGLHTSGGVILAGANIDAVVAPTVVRSFTNLPGAPAITVTRLGVGQYEVDFGTNIATRFYSGTIGQATASNVNNASIEVTPRGGNVNAVFVEMEDNAGVNVDADFWVYIL